MSCKPGQPCHEGRLRRMALGVLSAMALIFVLLSVASFLDSRGQVIPADVSYGEFGAVEGRRVFQAYNCMGCHTLLGNGAYLGPDLTNIYELAGPAWLEAFMPSARGWPTAAAVQVQLQKPEQIAATGIDSIDEYLARYPAAAERVARRGGGSTHMPNLRFRPGEVGKLIAFLRYTSMMNTEGWPPPPKVDGLAFALASPMPGAAVAATVTPDAVAAAAPEDPVAMGERLVADFACTACHATDAGTLIGPGWGGLHGSQVTLDDGRQVLADDAYLAESIRFSGAALRAGFAAGTMPSYDALLSAEQVDAIVAYLRTLSGEAQ